MYNILIKILDRYNILYHNQFGYRPVIPRPTGGQLNNNRGQYEKYSNINIFNFAVFI